MSFSGANAGHSAGYSLSLVAESTNGVLLGAERTATQGELPETVGSEASILLLQEIHRGEYLNMNHFKYV